MRLMKLDPRLRAAFDAEYHAASAAFAAGEVARAVEHIGRAHIRVSRAGGSTR